MQYLCNIYAISMQKHNFTTVQQNPALYSYQLSFTDIALVSVLVLGLVLVAVLGFGVGVGVGVCVGVGCGVGFGC
jgi:hypothetical protein